PRLSGRGAITVSPADFGEWRAAQTTLEDLAASQGSRDFVMHEHGSSEALRASLVTSNLFRALRATPAIGRVFTSQDEVRGSERVVILSDGFWRRRFAADPSVVGRTISFDTGECLVVGVMPATFMYPVSSTRPMDLWAPWAPDPTELLHSKSQAYNLQV